MLSVRIDLVPLGIEVGRRQLAEVRIVNDATGSTERGNYDVALMQRGRKTRHGRVVDWDRNQTAAELVLASLQAVLRGTT
jgi:hypothetical protein